MDFILLLVIVLFAVVLVPIMIGVIESRIKNVDTIIEFEKERVIVRSYAIERLFRLKGKSLKVQDIVKIQVTEHPHLLFGSCISLFNHANGSIDVWVPDYNVSMIVDRLSCACPDAIVEKV